MEKIRINGSINLTEISKRFKEGHSAFSKAKNKHGEECVFVAFTGWVNDATDNYTDLNMTLNSKQDKQASEGKVYIGNGRIKPTQHAAKVASDVKVNGISDDELAAQLGF